MDVFLLPVAPAPLGTEPPFELYCDPAPEPASHSGPDSDASERSFFGRMVDRFNRALAEGEAEERRREDGDTPADTGSRTSRFIKRKLAAAVAEQRLLWRLRNASSAQLFHPVTVTSPRALEVTLEMFRKDFSKHRLWGVIDALIVLASAPFALVPGPNFLAYYFIFRSVGHFFSMRGAQKGMEAAFWTPTPSAPLADLQQALAFDPPARAARIDAIAAALGLNRLAAFMRRIVDRSSR